MDGRRVPPALWLPVFVSGAVALVLHALSQDPSDERAVAKNGALAAYPPAATNLGAHLSAVVSVDAASMVRAVTLVRRHRAEMTNRSERPGPGLRASAFRSGRLDASVFTRAGPDHFRGSDQQVIVGTGGPCDDRNEAKSGRFPS